MPHTTDELTSIPSEEEVQATLARMSKSHHVNKLVLAELWRDTMAKTTRYPLTRVGLMYLEHGRYGQTYADFCLAHGVILHKSGVYARIR